MNVCLTRSSVIIVNLPVSCFSEILNSDYKKKGCQIINISNQCYFFPIINCCLKITNNFFKKNVKQVTHHLVSNIPTLRTENFYFSFSLEIVCCERKHACAAEMSWNSISPSHMPFTDSRSRDCLDLLIEQLG